MARRTHKPIVKHVDLLSDELKEEIRKKAKEEVLKMQCEQAAKDFLEACKQEEINATTPELADTKVMIDIPGFSLYYMVDGIQYEQGKEVTVSKNEAMSIWAGMQDAWRHERSNGGAYMKSYIPPRQDSVSAGGSSAQKLARI